MRLFPVLFLAFAALAQEARPLPAEDRAAIESLRRQILEAELTIARLQPKLNEAVQKAITAHGCASITHDLLCVPAPKKEEKK